MIKCGIIGLGKMGISHYAIANAHPDVQVVCVCDASSFVLGCLGKMSSVKLYDNYKKMLNDCELDSVVIATPTSSHFEIASNCLERNLHAFVEKPFTLKVEDSKKLTQLATEKKLANQVGFHNRFVAAFNKAAEIVHSGLLGEIYHFEGEAYGPVVLRQKGSTWRSKKNEGGGCLHDYASHVIDLINYYFGKPDKVSGTVLKKIYSRDVEDAVYSILSYKNGLSGSLSVNWSDETYRKMSTSITACGTKGKLVVNRQECQIYLKEASANLEKGWNILYTTDLTKPVWFYLRGEEYSAQMDYFIGSATGRNKDNINSFESAAQTDMVIDMLTSDAR